jgi:hypothetical protein
MRALVLASLVMTVLAVSCAERREAPAGHEQQPVSPQPVEIREPLRAPPPPAPPEIVFGEGDCAPVLGRGLVGTCIDGKPCNGFGFRDDAGVVTCGCYTHAGGCPDGTVCSPRVRGCVRIENADLPRPTGR